MRLIFSLDSIIGTLYNVLYCNSGMLQDGSIRYAQAGGPYQGSRMPYFSPGIHCRVSRVLEGGINMQDRSSWLCRLLSPIGSYLVRPAYYLCRRWRHMCFYLA